MKKIRALVVVALVPFLPGAAAPARADAPLLLRTPTVSRTHVAFAYGGDIWIVAREGGEARRLTSSVGTESGPFFSPDGQLVAFTGEYDGNVDVYVVAASGGEPRRLTWHPGEDRVLGWTPDGKRVLFRSPRSSYATFSRFFTVGLDGGFPEALPLPMGAEAAFSPDGARLAYVPNDHWQRAWKRYRGGQTSPLWIARLSDSSVERVPRDNSNDGGPMWVGDKVYFLSDRNGPRTLFAYDTGTRDVKEVLHNEGLDVKSAGACPDAIVYEQFGSLHLLDPASGESRELRVTLAGDFPSTRPHFEANAAKRVAVARLSPSGVRVAVEARGEILTVPAEKGDVRNLTRSPGVADRDPAWSPDGKRLAWFSDESGEYALVVRDQGGLGKVETVGLGEPPSFYYAPRWSPDGKKIAYIDKRLNVWYVDLGGGKPVKVDTDLFDRPDRILDPTWSPDSRWLAYDKRLRNQLGAVFVYSLQTGKATQLTDGMSDALFTAWDKDGKHLYFTASTDIGPAAAWLDMSSINRPVTRSVYVAVLRKDLPSPLAPESDEEKDEPAEKAGEKPDKAGGKVTDKPGAKPAGGDKTPEPVKVTIDFDGIGQRVLALPIPPRNYTRLKAGKSGSLFLVEGPPVDPVTGDPPKQTVHRFDLEKRKVEKLVEGISGFDLSANGEKLLYRQEDKWFIAGTTEPPKPGEGGLKLEALEVYVDPRAEWRQMYREVWRIERDFLYDPGFHGLDLKAIGQKYAPYLDGIASRDDLNYLFEEMLGELTLGHVFVGGGDVPEVPRVRGGLLGAEYTIENGRYRFQRVLSGENWNPDPRARAPLTQPGVNVVGGEYLLAVDGREVKATESVHRYFEKTAGLSVVLKVGPSPDGKGSREVTVVPLDSESVLRSLAWIEGNRRKVDALSNGRIAYVYLPDTAGEGYTNFNRYYFAQTDKEGAVIDERFNGGGFLADYIIDFLRRPQMSRVTTREGEDISSPGGSIYGPKAMIINEYAGSGGDAMPWYFRKAGIGPLVGKRTWGGLVGIWNYPALVDGGQVTAPRGAIYGLKGEWEVENVGIAPDIEVELDPQAVREGHDPQLEKAVEVVLHALDKNPLAKPPKPAYPNYHRAPR
jgi:tricorn protease